MANEKRLIDANLAVAKLKKMIKNDSLSKAEKEIFGMICKLFDNCPTVDAVEVVHGEWEMGLDEGDYEYGTCSVCGYNEYNAFGCLLPHNYCPNCGAKMDGGNEDG